MTKRVEYAGLLCLPGMFLFVFLGMFLAAGFLPPPSPSLTAEAVGAIYRNNQTGIILGMALMIVSATLFIPFFCVVADQIRRMRGAPGWLANAQVISGCLTVVLIIIPVMFFVAAAFRPERNVEITQAMNDTAWLIFTMPFGPAVLQALSLGLAVLVDQGGEDRVLPHWIAYLCFWLAFMFLPAGLIGFFKSGPFAWSGFLAFWLPIIVTAAAYAPIFLGLMRAIDRQHAVQEHSTAFQPAAMVDAR